MKSKNTTHSWRDADKSFFEMINKARKEGKKIILKRRGGSQ